MLGFREWMELQGESAVPQCVDLTKGQKDTSLDYWGAASKKGRGKKKLDLPDIRKS